MTIFSENPADRERPDDRKKGPFIGQERRVINGKKYASPKFKGSTRREVEIARDNWLVEVGGWDGFVAAKDALPVPEPTKPEVLLTGEYLDKWFEESISHWAGTTLGTNTSTFNVWVKNAKSLREIAFPPEIDDIKNFYKTIGTSDHTKFRVHKLLVSAFGDAVAERKIPYNPCKFPKCPKKPKEGTVEAFSPDDERALKLFVKDDPYWGPLLHFAFDAGVRQQELFGLQVRDIDFDHGTVSISRTVDTLKGVAVLKDITKTDASRRTFDLSLTTLAALRRLIGAGKNRSVHVFTEGDRLWTRTRFSTAWTKLLLAVEVSHLGFHSTRHTMATRLLRRGNFLTAVSARLGHSKPSITLDTYSHALPKDQGPLAADYDAFEAEVAPEIAPEVLRTAA
jgi:integrase